LISPLSKTKGFSKRKLSTRTRKPPSHEKKGRTAAEAIRLKCYQDNRSLPDELVLDGKIAMIRWMVTSDWNEYRRRRLQLLLTYVMFIPVSIFVFALCGLLNFHPIVFSLVGFSLAILLMISVGRFSAFACPRCNQFFFGGRFQGNPFAGSCLHCGLPKWSQPSQVELVAWRRGGEWDCLSCKNTMPAWSDVCDQCGWSYHSEKEG